MTVRYRHLTRPAWVAMDLDQVDQQLVAQRTNSLCHLRALLFVVVALIVGGGLLTIAPDFNAPTVDGELANGSNGPLMANPIRTSALSSADQPSGSEAASPQDVAQSSSSSSEQASVPNLSPIFTPEVRHWAPKIASWSAEHSLDPNIIATIMQIESCGDPQASSHVGAQGLFQVMPFHFAPGEDKLDPDTNALRGLAFYNRQLDYTNQDVYLSFAGYNGGYAASGSSFPSWADETQRYFTWAKGIFDDASAGLVNSPTLKGWLAAGGGSLCRQAAQRLGL
jgi:hypothetical protein